MLKRREEDGRRFPARQQATARLVNRFRRRRQKRRRTTLRPNHIIPNILNFTLTIILPPSFPHTNPRNPALPHIILPRRGFLIRRKQTNRSPLSGRDVAELLRVVGDSLEAIVPVQARALQEEVREEVEGVAELHGPAVGGVVGGAAGLVGSELGAELVVEGFGVGFEELVFVS